MKKDRENAEKVNRGSIFSPTDGQEGAKTMAFIRSIETVAKKFATVTPTRVADYAEGVANPRRDWAQATAAAEGAYEAGVQQSIVKKRFGKGVKKAGSATWQRGAEEKGAARWGPGVQLAQDKYAAGFAPYHDTIAATKLPPRYARRDPRNLERVKAISMALAARKETELNKG